VSVVIIRKPRQIAARPSRRARWGGTVTATS
jgi:hypothetical protein